MKAILTRTVYYPRFQIGERPAAIAFECQLFERKGKKFIRTPFSTQEASENDLSLNSLTDHGSGLFATETDCMAYLEHEYPWHTEAAILMLEYVRRKIARGNEDARNDMAELLNLPIGNVEKACMGSREFGLGDIRNMVKSVDELHITDRSTPANETNIGQAFFGLVCEPFSQLLIYCRGLRQRKYCGLSK